MTQATIRTLQDMGASRWTKGNHDRLYIKNIVQDILELDVNRYNTGNISSATVLGQKVSNAAAGRILTATDATYIDLKTGALMMNSLTEKVDGVYTDLTALVKKALEKMEEAQDSTPEPSTAPTIDTDAAITVQETTEAVKKEKEAPTMKKPLSNPVFIRYYAFTNEPFAFDAEGYVDASALKDMYKNDWYTRQEGDDTVARKGYKLVSDGTDMWVVKENDIYTVVYEEPALTNGYGLAYPAGGMTSTYGYDLETEIDGERVLLQRSNW